MEWLIRPEDPASLDERHAGGKGASLARLVERGANVPQFAVVSVDAFSQFHGHAFPEALNAELRALLAVFGDTPLAVRSSAVGEDAPDSSFAGLYHTSLDVRGFEALTEAIHRCWASYDEQPALDYRNRHEAPEGGMGVVIQEMVQADWAGVCFTADPVRLALSDGLLNAVPGLGEALVSGAVNPEEMRVHEGQLMARRRGDHAEVMPERLAVTVWKAAVEIAEWERFPQDVEWACSGDRVFILQSRPITTVADLFYSRLIEPWRDDPRARPEEPERLWSRAYADETWTPPVSPLFYNVQHLGQGRIAYLRMHGESRPLPPDVFKYHQASAYVDVRLLQRMHEYQPRMARISGILNFFPEEMRRQVANAPFRWLGRLRRTLFFELRQRQLRSIRHNYRTIAHQWPGFLKIANRWLHREVEDLSLSDLRGHHAEVSAVMARVGPPCSIGVLYHALDLHLLLTGLLDRWCGDGEVLYAQVTSGLDDSETVREAESLWQFAAEIKRLGGAPLELASSEAATWASMITALRADPAGASIAADLDGFWRSHRHRGASYKDLIYPRWGDDPDGLLQAVRGYVRSDAPSPAQINAVSAEKRRRDQRAILGRVPRRQRWILRWLFTYNERYMAARDNHRFYFDRVWYELRRIYLGYGRHLCAAGKLGRPEDVFFLGTDEVESALSEGLEHGDARRRVDVRRAQWERTLRVQPPKFLKGYTPHEPAPISGDDAVIRGIGVSPGEVTGTARVVFGVAELGRIQDGEILVTRQTDPAWTIVFARIGGLVLETGGVLAHGSSLCREYGLPCVSAVEQATARILDGSTIRVIGSAGTVQILDTQTENEAAT